MSGIVKRRDCRKLLSAWRSSYAILLPSQLLFYSAEADGKPKAVLDLAPDIRVRRSVSSKQQAGDAKRVKMQPFLIDLDGKALYEVIFHIPHHLSSFSKNCVTFLLEFGRFPPKVVLRRKRGLQPFIRLQPAPCRM